MVAGSRVFVFGISILDFLRNLFCFYIVAVEWDVSFIEFYSFFPFLDWLQMVEFFGCDLMGLDRLKFLVVKVVLSA